MTAAPADPASTLDARDLDGFATHRSHEVVAEEPSRLRIAFLG